MRSLFTIGFQSSPFLGQDSGSDKKKFYDSLDQAENLSYAIDDWKGKHPNLQQDLGSDWDNWQLLEQDITTYGSTAKAVKQKLDADPNADIGPDDQKAAQYWATAIGREYVLVANHTGTPVASKTAAPAPPAAPTAEKGLDMPLIVGVGAAAVLGLILLATAKG